MKVRLRLRAEQLGGQGTCKRFGDTSNHNELHFLPLREHYWAICIYRAQKDRSQQQARNTQQIHPARQKKPVMLASRFPSSVAPNEDVGQILFAFQRTDGSKNQIQHNQ